MKVLFSLPVLAVILIVGAMVPEVVPWLLLVVVLMLAAARKR